MKPTVKQVAAAAGVSPGTVSNALNGRKGVSTPVRDHVLHVAREIGYLQTRALPFSQVIRFVMFRRHGHVVSDTPFFASLIDGIERECRRTRLELRLTHIHMKDPDFDEILTNLSQEPAAGLIILATEMQEQDHSLFTSVKVPMVLLDNRFHDNPCDAVLIDNAGAAWKAVNLLIKLGHSRIGHLCGHAPIRNFSERKRGYLEAMADAGLKPRPEDCYQLSPSFEGAYQDMLALLQGKCTADESPASLSERSLPTAFFAGNDIIAAGAMRAMQQNGIRIPQDVSIIGFDDMPFCEYMNPRLTTVRVYKQEMGALAVHRLVEKRALMSQVNQVQGDKDLVRQVTEVQTGLVLRDSHQGLMSGQTGTKAK